VQEDVKQVKRLRSESLATIFELMQYPISISDTRVADIFIDYLTRIQSHTPLKLSNKVFPGVILLAFHRDRAVSDWARETLRKCGQEISLGDLVEAEGIITSVYHAIIRQFSLDKPSSGDGGVYAGFLRGTGTKELVKGLGRCISLMKVKAIDEGLFVLLPSLVELMETLLDPATKGYEGLLTPVMNCLQFLVFEYLK
jgi:hypothetical protein